jgi:hypothetical protein
VLDPRRRASCRRLSDLGAVLAADRDGRGRPPVDRCRDGEHARGAEPTREEHARHDAGAADADRVVELLAQPAHRLARDGAADVAGLWEAELPVALRAQASRLPHEELARHTWRMPG